jgi:hypothetical protein
MRHRVLSLIVKYEFVAKESNSIKQKSCTSQDERTLFKFGGRTRIVVQQYKARYVRW